MNESSNSKLYTIKSILSLEKNPSSALSKSYSRVNKHRRLSSPNAKHVIYNIKKLDAAKLNAKFSSTRASPKHRKDQMKQILSCDSSMIIGEGNIDQD